jgi:hypothetical protein
MAEQDKVANAIVALIKKKITAQIAFVLLVAWVVELVLIEESPYARLFQVPIALVGIIALGFWFWELSDREKDR